MGKEGRKMKLEELLQFDDIIIQCHDDPDADAIASGYGILTYLRRKGKNVRLIYGGRNRMQKSNLVLMVELLDIQIDYVTELDRIPELLLTVDCRQGERNVQKFGCRALAAIDHHKVGMVAVCAMQEIRDNYGACATIVWDMLCDAGVEVEEDETLATALYYGLFMDTNRMQELAHPKDRDMRSRLEFRCSRSILFQLQNNNLSLEEMRIAADALSDCDYYREDRFAVAQARQCDPNILGIIGDLMIEVDAIRVCVACCRQSGGVKFSVRSGAWETQANQLAQYLAEGLGNGGGHARKAGGFLNGGLLEETLAGRSLRQFFAGKLEEYFNDQDLIFMDGGEGLPDMAGADLYRKKQIAMGYVYVRDMGYPSETRLRIRMLEGDRIEPVREDTVLILGAESEVYVNSKAYFLAHNIPKEEPYVFREEYIPAVAEAVQAEMEEDVGGEVRSVKDLARICVVRSDSCIRARQLKRRTKLLWAGKEECMEGAPGDWLAAREEDLSDIYIIKRRIFEKTYTKEERP